MLLLKLRSAVDTVHQSFMALARVWGKLSEGDARRCFRAIVLALDDIDAIAPEVAAIIHPPHQTGMQWLTELWGDRQFTERHAHAIGDPTAGDLVYLYGRADTNLLYQRWADRAKLLAVTFEPVAERKTGGSEDGFIAASKLGWQDKLGTTSTKDLHKFLKENPAIRTRHPSKRRLEINAVDWLKACALKDDEATTGRTADREARQLAQVAQKPDSLAPDPRLRRRIEVVRRGK